MAPGLPWCCYGRRKRTVARGSAPSQRAQRSRSRRLPAARSPAGTTPIVARETSLSFTPRHPLHSSSPQQLLRLPRELPSVSVAIFTLQPAPSAVENCWFPLPSSPLLPCPRRLSASAHVAFFIPSSHPIHLCCRAATRPRLLSINFRTPSCLVFP